MTHLLSSITQVQWNGTIERMGQSKRNPMAQVTEQRQRWAVSIWKWYCPGGQGELLQSGESSRDSRPRLHDHSPVSWYPVSPETEKDSREPTQPHGLWSPWYLRLWMRTMKPPGWEHRTKILKFSSSSFFLIELFKIYLFNWDRVVVHMQILAIIYDTVSWHQVNDCLHHLK